MVEELFYADVKVVLDHRSSSGFLWVLCLGEQVFGYVLL